MASFSINDADKYGGQGGGGYFSLKNDKEVASVRFLYDSIEDVQGYAVHEIELDGKKRYVNCLREYGQPMDICPFCAAKKFVTAKYFIPIYNIDEDRVQTWERGKKFGNKLSSLCARYPHLVSHTFEIERNGKQGEQTTTYEIYETGCNEDVSLEDFEINSPLGSHILEKSADEMQYFLDRGVFPTDGSSDAPVSRRESRDRDDERVSRRTPTGRGGREVY